MSQAKFQLYHSSLRVLVLVFTVLLVLTSGVISSTTAQYLETTQQQLASAIGVSVGVPPNELNVITARLTEMEQQLLARESALREREIVVGIGGGANPATDKSTFVLAGILFILLILIVMNYVLDFMRSQSRLNELSALEKVSQG
jgi:3-dehydroquinate synthetase